MKVYKGLEEFEKLKNAIVTTGTFDGVHQGHRKILNRLIEVAKKNKGESVLITFFPHPRMVLQPDSDLKLINTIDEKIELLREVGIDHLIIHPFTKEFSRTTSLEFVRDLLVNEIGTTKLVIGYDHHFGRNREGSFEHLKEFGPIYGFEVEEISVQDVDNVNVSSTKVRKALEDGEVDVAANYLGYSFFLQGVVVHGQKIGRELGYPTANVEIQNPYKLIPANGIYAVKVNVGNEMYNGMLNIGTRPTIEHSDKVSVEVHLFNFSEDIYGKEITVSLVQRIRSEKKFDNREALIAEMEKDKVRVEQVLR
ncbi:MAG: riboflavin kinase/FMN adenylyltransferase [Vicingaceae bacterium]